MECGLDWSLLGALFSEREERVRDAAALCATPAGQGIITASISELVAPELFFHLQRFNALDLISADGQQLLQDTVLLNEFLHKDLSVVFQDVITVATSVGVKPTVLKGGIDIVSPRDAINRSRVVGDLDLWLPGTQAEALFQGLVDRGFRIDDKSLARYGAREWHHHLHPLWHPEVNQYVEIHRALGPGKPFQQLTDCLSANSVERSCATGQFYVPTLTMRLCHSVLHHRRDAALASNAHRSFRHTLDYVRMCRLLDDVDRVFLADNPAVMSNQGLRRALKWGEVVASTLDPENHPRHGGVGINEMYWLRIRAKWLSRALNLAAKGVKRLFQVLGRAS